MLPARKIFYVKRGALLIESLIATTILAIGVVSALRVFSGSLTVSARSLNMQKVSHHLDDQLFGWFLDPTSFNPNTVAPSSQLKTSDKLVSQIITQKLQPIVATEDKKNAPADNPPQGPKPVVSNINFYEANLKIVDSRQRPQFQNIFYLVEYGNKKQA